MSLYGPQDRIPRGTPVQIVFGYSAVLPEFFFDEAETWRLVQSMGVNVRKVDIDALIPGFRKLVIEFDIDRDVTFGDLGNEMAHKIDEHFRFVFDVMAERFETPTAPSPIAVPVTTAVSLASIAVVVLIAFLLVKRF
jgi:hypothetical protein